MQKPYSTGIETVTQERIFLQGEGLEIFKGIT